MWFLGKKSVGEATTTHAELSALSSSDVAVLERAADAVKILDRSSHATDALELARMQETTQQQRYMSKIKECEAKAEAAKADQKRMDQEGKRKILEEETRQVRLRAEHEDRLMRKRFVDKLKLQQQQQETLLRQQEKSLQRQERIRRQTIDYETELKKKRHIHYLEKEIQMKNHSEQENRKMFSEKLRIMAQEHRITILQSIKMISSIIGSGAGQLISDWEKLLAAAGGFSLLALGIFAAKGATGVLTHYMEAHLNKPALVAETSRFTLLDAIRHPRWYWRRLRSYPEDSLQGTVFDPVLEYRLLDIAIATRNTRVNKGFYRNILMYGPPGTGKTMFARKLAEHSGMDYAIMTGGDVVPLGKESAVAIHKLFDWAHTSRRGLLLLVDEADAFLRKRTTENISDNVRGALNAFLYRISEQNSKFMLVLVSNTPEQFDYAINNRLDDMVEFKLPDWDERERLLRLYFNKYVLRPAFRGPRRFRLEDIDYCEICSKMATACEGFSGREIAKLGVSWQAALYTSEDNVLRERMIWEKCVEAVQQHKLKMTWLSDEEQSVYKALLVKNTQQQ